MVKLYIPVILGTVRKGRFSEFAAALVHQALRSVSEVETKLIDIRELPFDFADEGESQKDENFSEEMSRADGYVIVTPEYNRSYPGSLKHALDTNYKEYRYKPAGLCGVSSGKVGGARAINALLPVLKIYGMYVIRPEIYFASIQEAYDSKGNAVDPELIEGYQKQIPAFISELLRVAGQMKALRTNLKSK